ncbi:MAG TPA: response regulator [Caulobacteraceae bacterium]
MDTLGPISDQREQVAALIARICEEIRGPFDVIAAAADRLARLRLPPEAGDDLQAIGSAASSMIALLETAAQLQRAELGQLVLSQEPRLVIELIDDIETRWRDRALAAGVCLIVAYDGDHACAARLDAARVAQVVDALIGHALAHVRAGVVEVSVKTRVDGDAVCLHCAVRDNNTAYAAPYLAALFAADLADGEVGRPRGMGPRLELALAARLVEAMGGRLGATANVGVGATMAFEIAVPAAGRVAADKGDRARPKVAHVLVVDDNATNRMVVEALCEMFDCTTEAVVDGQEALEAARVGRFDVILMDIKMPRMDGLTATREIRKLKGPAGRTPIVALTANADPEDVREYLAVGMVGVVEKPIKPERLLEALDAALSGASPSAMGEAAAA